MEFLLHSDSEALFLKKSKVPFFCGGVRAERSGAKRRPKKWDFAFFQKGSLLGARKNLKVFIFKARSRTANRKKCQSNMSKVLGVLRSELSDPDPEMPPNFACRKTLARALHTSNFVQFRTTVRPQRHFEVWVSFFHFPSPLLKRSCPQVKIDDIPTRFKPS